MRPDNDELRLALHERSKEGGVGVLAQGRLCRQALRPFALTVVSKLQARQIEGLQPLWVQVNKSIFCQHVFLADASLSVSVVEEALVGCSKRRCAALPYLFLIEVIHNLF